MEVESKMNESVEMLSAIKDVEDELRLLRHFLEMRQGLIGKETYAAICQGIYEKKRVGLKDIKND